MKASLLAGFSMSMVNCSNEADTCHLELSDEGSSDSPKGCCEIPNCDCLCCGYVLLEQSPKIEFGLTSLNMPKSSFYFSNTYSHLNYNPVWHPPQVM